MHQCQIKSLMRVVKRVMKNNLLPVLSAGFKYIASALLAFIIFSIFDADFLAFISFIVMVAFVFVYRNPERELPSFEKNSLVSPVDGKIISIDNIQDTDYAYKIEIDTTLLDVGVLRTPLDATLKSVDIKRGARLAKNSHLYKDINEKVELVFADENSNSVKVRHQLKRSFNDINIDAVDTQNLKQASRYGLMINGITTIYLPKNFRLNVSVGSEIKGSQTLIGYFS